MSTYHWFLFSSATLVSFWGTLFFESWRALGQSLFWFLFPNSISSWVKNAWERDRDHSTKMWFFLMVAVVLVGINYAIFHFLIY